MNLDGFKINSITVEMKAVNNILFGNDYSSGVLEMLNILKKALDEKKIIYFKDSETHKIYKLTDDGLIEKE